MRPAFLRYLRDIDALLERQSALTRALVVAMERHRARELDDAALAEIAQEQLAAYTELEADARAMDAPAPLAEAHELFARAFAGGALAHRRLLRSLDHDEAPDLQGFEPPALCLNAATDAAYLAARALA